MKTTRKITATLIAIILFVVIFAGCTAKNGDEDTTEKTTVATTTDEANSDTATTVTQQDAQVPSATTKSGDIVRFGKYEQDNDLSNEKETIFWRVLTVENGKALLLADKILDCQPYNIENKDVTWEICTLRAWLNNGFLNTAFDADEKAKISTTKVVNEDKIEGATSGGNDTDDKLFLISYSEVINPAYGFSSDSNEFDTARWAQGTEFSISQGLWVSDNGAYSGNSLWWLRSPGNLQNEACSIGDVGIVRYNYSVEGTYLGIRPALWVEL